MLSADQMDEPLEGVEAHDSDDVAAALRSVGDEKAALYVEEQADRIETLDAEIARLRTAGQDAHDALTHALHLLSDDCNQRIGMDGALSRLTAALSPTTEQEGG